MQVAEDELLQTLIITLTLHCGDSNNDILVAFGCFL